MVIEQYCHVASASLSDVDAEAGVVGDGSFEEGDSTLLALVGHELDESDARGIVDADVDELPAYAEMAVDRAPISTGDAVSHGADPAKLLEMDEFAWALAFIGAGSARLAPRHRVCLSPAGAEPG